MVTTKNSRTFCEVFVSNFHDKLSFAEFLNFDINGNLSAIHVHGREVIQPSQKLKSILSFIVKNILEYASIAEDVVFSYRKGVNVRNAIAPHSSSQYFFQTDIKNFFGSLNKEVVRKVLKSRLESVPISDLSQFEDLILDLVVYQNSLPLGFPTSPALSNACLFDFDNDLSQACRKESIHYTRYADDMILSGNCLDSLTRISQTIETRLSESVHTDLALNKSKTRLLKRGQRIKLLGLVILPNGRISIEKKTKKEIETLLHLYLSDPSKFINYADNIREIKSKSVKIVSRDTALAMLSGRLLAANAMDPAYVMKLRGKYGNTLIDMFLHKSAK